MQYPTEIKLKPFSLTENFCYVTAIVDPVTFYKRRTTIIIGISGSIKLVNVMLYFRGRGIVGGGGGVAGGRKGRCGNVPVKNTLSPIFFTFFLPPNPLPLSTPESKSKFKIMPIVSCFIRLTCPISIHDGRSFYAALC